MAPLMMMPHTSHYETIVKPHLKELRTYCFRLSGSTWDGEDLYQEALLKSLRYYVRAGHIKDVKPFLFRVARNVWIDEYRMRQRRNWTSSIVTDVSIMDVSYSEIRGAVEWLAARLSDRHLEMWLLAEYFGFTMKEIAARQHMTMSAVRSALHRARMKLRESKSQSKPSLRRNAADQRIEYWVRCIMKDSPPVFQEAH